MDKISKQILNKLKNSNDFSIRFSGIDNFFDDIAEKISTLSSNNENIIYSQII